jgi:class 3 adenylate cyclase
MHEGGTHPVSFEPGWDAIDRFSLRFYDRELELQYRAQLLDVRRPRQRLSYVAGALIFGCLAVAGPVLLNVSAWPFSAILVAAAILSVAAAILAGWVRTSGQLDAVGIATQLVTGLTLVAAATLIGGFTRYAAPALMGISIFSLAMSRHPFRNAVIISAGQIATFVAFGIGQGLAPGIFVDTIILSATLAGACVGTYLAERTDRRLFTQNLAVADLNRRINELFHRYVAPEVADAVIADPAKAQLGGEEVEVTVLFADLTGFTSFSEGVRPEEAVAMLNAAFGAAVPVVLDEGGTIVQFAGDALMAIFNAPVRQADHALRAARAALRLQESVAAGRSNPATPQFRVGLNTGPALVGNIGSAELHNFTAIGDTTNLAARLQTFAPPGSVILAQPTLDRLGDRVVVRPLGSHSLKGRAMPAVIYELLEIRPTHYMVDEGAAPR